MSKHAERGADAGRGDDDQVEAARLVEALRQAGLPAEQFADRVRGRPGQHRHREQAGADDAEREDEEREVAGDRPQRLGRLRRRLDVGDAVLVQRHRRRDHDAQRDQVRERHAEERVLLDARQVLGDVPGCSAQRVARSAVRRVVLDLLRRLPEEQVRADRRAEHRDDHRRVLRGRDAGREEGPRLHRLDASPDATAPRRRGSPRRTRTARASATSGCAPCCSYEK